MWTETRDAYINRPEASGLILRLQHCNKNQGTEHLAACEALGLMALLDLCKRILCSGVGRMMLPITDAAGLAYSN